jgi:hypothetical protein
MSTDPSRYIRDLEPGQRVFIKTGTFGGMQGVVTDVRSGTGEPEPATLVYIEVRVRGRPAPVLFTNPTAAELERI